MNNGILLVFFAFLTMTFGCSMNKLAVNATAKVLVEAGPEMETESNWEMFKDGLPANIKMMEGMLYVDPANEILLFNMVKAYSAYGFGVLETEYLEDYFLENDESKFKEQAIYHYSKSMMYGIRYFKSKGLGEEFFYNQVVSENDHKLLSKKLSDPMEIESIFFFAQAFGSLVNLQRGDIKLLSYLPKIKSLMDYACGKNPELNFGACDIFYGAYEAGRPKTLGGNPDKGKEIFKNLIKKYPDNLLAHVSYLQFYVIPFEDKEEFTILKTELVQKIEQFKAQMRWGNENKFIVRNPRMNVFNSIAIKRFETILKFEKKLF